MANNYVNGPIISFFGGEVPFLGPAVDIDYPSPVIWDDSSAVLWDDGTAIEWSNTVTVNPDAGFKSVQPIINFSGEVD